MSAALIAACFSIAACNPAATTAPAPTPAKVEAPAAFVPADGEPQAQAPLAKDDPAIAAFGVVKFNELYLTNVAAVRLFGIAGSDPAMNGLKVYLAFVSPNDERAFLLGDFRDYRVIAASPGRLDLEYDQDIMDANNNMQQRTFRAIVSWTEKAQEESPNPEYPAAVTITPAK